MDLHPASKERRTERWNSPAEEARRERKTGSVPKVTEKGGWTAHRESARKKDGRTGTPGTVRREKGRGRRRRRHVEERSSRGLVAAGTGVVVFFNIVVVVVDVVVLIVVVFSPLGRQASFFLFSPFSNYR